MNLIEERFQNKEEKKRKNTTKIIVTAIIFLIIIIIAIISYLIYLQSSIMKLSIDGVANEKFKSLLVFEPDGTIYVPIKEASGYFNYESYNGEYSEKSEEKSKCYATNSNEVINFELGKNKIYKLDLTDKDSDYEYIYIKKPIKAINGMLYISTEGLEKAFNISFEYDQDRNTINIWTLPYLYQTFSMRVLDYYYVELSNKLVNQRAILDNKLIVQKDKENNQYGVINTDGTVILEPKYDNITYLPNTGDFLVEVNKKVGILSETKETKVQIIYDSIELMDSDTGLYIVKKDDKYGVIDIKGNIKIYIENDEIGIDPSKFTQNNIKNRYLLADNLIPVRKNEYWGLFDKTGNQVVEYKYDDFGYIANSNRDALNLLIIPSYNVLVARKDNKYTLVNSYGIELFAPVADDIYMSISGGEKHYYIVANDQKWDAEEFLNRNGITAKDENIQQQEQKEKNNENTNSSNMSNTDNANNTDDTDNINNTNNTDIKEEESDFINISDPEE